MTELKTVTSSSGDALAAQGWVVPLGNLVGHFSSVVRAPLLTPTRTGDE